MQKDGELNLEILKPGDLLPTQIVLDRNAWLPKRASRPWLFGAVVWEFSDYAEFLGTKWPRKSQLHQGLASDSYELKDVRFVPSASPKRYAVRGDAVPIKWDARLSRRWKSNALLRAIISSKPK